MKLWQNLYAMIWIVLLEFLLAMTPVGDRAVLRYVHIALGVTILGLAYSNFEGFRKTRVPGRVKRTAKSTFQLSIVLLATGVLLALRVGAGLVILAISISLFGLILFFHVFNAFAIITQAAAVAIAHDMWEDKEFVQESEVGEVPEMPVPAKAALTKTVEPEGARS